MMKKPKNNAKVKFPKSVVLNIKDNLIWVKKENEIKIRLFPIKVINMFFIDTTS